jgi:hypothetical protein
MHSECTTCDVSSDSSQDTLEMVGPMHSVAYVSSPYMVNLYPLRSTCRHMQPTKQTHVLAVGPSDRHGQSVRGTDRCTRNVPHVMQRVVMNALRLH